MLPHFPGSGFVGRRFSDDSLGGLMPSEFPAILVGAAGAAPGPEVGPWRPWGLGAGAATMAGVLEGQAVGCWSI